ncbi:uncharacterized protein PAC_14608 [Phialocephala subalpina]|uniref:Zn(2)-C6 fungal-type domain-containing protein n=1 Tax=Phialocephala subalpina TaxID=576137 RepID=A0A1L7XI34_9HELO|nr:uncharacterized protein PAC_14608 [Phialocephala subalpina]
MPRVVKGQRKRTYRPKTRSGFRHVKCGEERPSCLRCVSTGRTCDGYENIEDLSSSKPSSPPTSIVFISTPSHGIIGTDRERRSFHFFRQTTAAQFSRFYGEDIWDRLILQTCHFEPAIRHAIIALGSIHERFVTHNGLINKRDCLDDFALQQYSLAIQSLMSPVSRNKRPSADVCLAACSLFACFESMQGSYGPAIAHVRSGSKILIEMKYDDEKRKYSHDSLDVANNPYIPTPAIEDLFLRLDFSVSQMVGGHHWALYERISKSRLGFPMPATFSTLAQARDHFIFNWNRCSHSLDERGMSHTRPDFNDLFSVWQESLSIIDSWSASFESFLSVNGEKLSENEKKGAGMLQILRDVGFISLRIERSRFDDQTVWDEFCPMYEKIVNLAAEILESNAGVPQFTLDMGIIGPLYEVTARCRDPFIRRKAISLLKGAQSQEGVWNSFLTATVAERVVQIEEAGLGEVRCCADVPDWARISNVDPKFDPIGRKARLRYMRLTNLGDEVRNAVEEVIEW